MQDKIIINDHAENDPLYGENLDKIYGEGRNNIMEMLIMNTYKMRNPTKEKLLNFGFTHNSSLSDSESGTEFYTLFFPVLKYNKKATVLGEIDVELNTGEVFVNAIKANTRTAYHQFYNSECQEGYSYIIEKINKAFNDMFDKLSISKIEYKEGDTVE